MALPVESPESRAPAELPEPEPTPQRAAGRPRRGAARRWTQRIVALLALLGGAAAVVGAVAGVHHGAKSLSQADAQVTLARLDDVNRPLGDRLVALRPGQSARDAQTANRAAYQLAKRLQTTVSTGGEIGQAVHAVLVAEVAYTDALGSTMFNSRSPLREKIVPYASTLRSALDDANGNPQLVRGAANFVAFARFRAGG